MIVARSIKVEPYITKGDLESTEPTKFLLKTLSAMDVASFQDSIMSSDKQQVSFVRMQDLLKKALVGWENLKDESDQLVKFSLKDADANLNLLPAEVIAELIEHVMKVNFPGDESEKNS